LGSFFIAVTGLGDARRVFKERSRSRSAGMSPSKREASDGVDDFDADQCVRRRI